MTRVTNKLTWAVAVESYLETITYPSTRQEAIDIAMDEIRRLAREMDKINGCEYVPKKSKSKQIKSAKNAERDSRLVKIITK